MLYDHLYRPENLYRHNKWVIFEWDNVGVVTWRLRL